LPDDEDRTIGDTSDISDYLHDTEGIVRATFDADWADEAGFHDWNLVLEYEDGRIEMDYLGRFDGEPPDWVWAIYEWYEDQDVDVDIDYEEA